MKLLKEIFHNEQVDVNGRTISRKAVRGVIADNKKLLMIYSRKNGDYKFPGGGIKRGESHEAALKREVAEETGKQVAGKITPFLKVIEYDLPLEREYDVFKMTSYYYWCQVKNTTEKQNLDEYEKELGFLPVWIELDAAIANNASLLANLREGMPRWVKRELQVLEKIAEKTRITPLSNP